MNILRMVMITALACGAVQPQTPKWVEGKAELDLLRRPRAIPAKGAPESVEQLRQGFADPPADYRSMPLWVWNDEMSWPRMQEQLRQFKQQGMGGVFVHPRPGLMTEYLSDEWFRLWKLSLDEGKRLGIQVNIYDENSYPGGFAGGHVPAQAPDTVLQYLTLQEAVAKEHATRGGVTVLATFAVEKDAGGKVVSARRVESRDDVRPGETAAIFGLRRASAGLWTAGFPYVDLTNPATTLEFLKSTYEPYRAHFGTEFGKNLKYAFNDEPQLLAGASDSPLPLTRYSLAEFRRRCGYDLTEKLPSLYWDVGDWRQVRFDYWQTIHDLWKENFFRRMFQYCDHNNLQFTGHWMEHEWPYPFISPADASYYAFEHMPGIDLLEGANLRLRGADEHYLFTIKQVASVGHQLGRRVFCEAYGVSGWDSTFEHYKRFGDWLEVHGVNFMDQHLAYETIRGARKRDHPQSFTDVAAWWPYYKLHGDHIGRVSYMLTRGVARNRLLVLEPTTSGFLWARRGAQTPELAEMKSDYGRLVQFLADHQVDFDLADEYILEWFGGAKGKQLVVGQAAYDLLVWPATMINIRKETLPRLEKYLAGGGEVVALAEPAAYVDGRPSDQVRALRDRYAAQWHRVADLDQALSETRKRLPGRVSFSQELPQVGFAERFLASGDRILFFANTSLKPARATASVEGGAVEECNTVSGKLAPVAFEADGAGRVKLELDIPPAGSLMLLVKKSGPAAKPKPAAQFEPLQASAWKSAAETANVLVLDYCDLKLETTEYRDMNTYRANFNLWYGHGYERPIWDSTIQYNKRFFEMSKVLPHVGFEATFRFQVEDAAALGGIELALESSELYKITVNGTPISFVAAKRWLDPHIRSAVIAKAAKVGENVVVITGKPFDVRMELENIFLRGNFSVKAAGKGFVLAAPSALNLGSWAKQGRPFDSGSALYQSEVNVPAGSNRLRVEVKRWEGTVLEVLVDGKRAAVMGWQPYLAEVPVTAGKHTVGVRVVSTPRNTLGPFFNPTLRMRAWPGAWGTFPEHQPEGARYDVLDYGLMEAPVVSAAR